MKIYTEVNYDLINDCLVESDSKSYEYEGEVLFCGSTGGQVEDVVEEAVTMVDEGGGKEEEEEEEEELDPDDPAFVPGKGFAQRVKGYDPFLKIQKQTKGVQGQFTRGSLRVNRPS